jgi:hypothetical protein
LYVDTLIINNHKCCFLDLSDTNVKFKEIICYLKNLKNLSNTNIKLKGPTDAS